MPALPLAQKPVVTTDAPEPARLAAPRPVAATGRDFHITGDSIVARKPLCETAETERVPGGDLIRSDEDLVVRLCRMPVNLAAPLLRASLPSLTPQALLALIVSTGEAHHLLIACRPYLDWRVVKALLRTQSDKVLIALTTNPTLDFDDDDQAFIARRGLENPVVRAAVFGHQGLIFAKSQLRLQRGEDVSHSNLKLIALLRGGETAGFVRELARRLSLDTAALSQALTTASPVPLALVMCAAGLDRALFQHLLSLWQKAYGGEPYMAESQRALILSVFNLTPATARQKLAVLMNPAH
ncbi:DUF2336 domain-containing protein [Asticcacaulis benevestitus]|uniref:DUF2336 domain-containing protein n=1 Tax=Asticcacaulis benevestitus DSM 16100 = ATCC BAA-896 TaxID=1121022 RepID=V4PJX6_9CAUL|nr:DUF2336 domain-containing protein [Asticcacaulis benevestitus]ESQ88521.1 hypothetical protein ABENE_15865 [Asticcacaulis benevestitus DSM 16100 = ATCC BAA-896]